MGEVEDWRLQAKCLGVDPNLMQPERATVGEVDAATEVCTGCLVRVECRGLAESQVEPFGVHDGEWWGADPVWMVDRACERCGDVFRTERDGRRSGRFCGSRCRVAAHRAARALSA